MCPQQDCLQPTEQIALQPPPQIQPYALQPYHTSQSQLQPQPMTLPFALNLPWTSREDSSPQSNQNQLLQMGMDIFNLMIDTQTAAAEAGRIQEAVDFCLQWGKVAAQYKDKSESMVRELEERRRLAETQAQWPSHPTPNPYVYPMPQHATQDIGTKQNAIWDFPTNHNPPNLVVNEGPGVATYGNEAHPMTSGLLPDARDPIGHSNAWSAETGEPHKFTVTLKWRSDKLYCTRVLVGDLIRPWLASKWPDSLLIGPTWRAMDHDKFQQWLRVHKPVQVRLRAALETEKDEFQQLLGHLRENGWYAAASWGIQGGGQSTADLLLAPSGRGLIGALFPVSGMPEPAKSQLQQLDPTMDSIASYLHRFWNEVAVPDACMQERRLPAQQNQQPTLSRGHAETTGYGDTGMNTGQFDGNGLNISRHAAGESGGPSWLSDAS